MDQRLRGLERMSRRVVSAVLFAGLLIGGAVLRPEEPVTGTVKEASFPFSRMRRAGGPPLEQAAALPLQQRHARWTGMRTLTDEQIHELAQHVVDEIRERGPFLSLAEFVNRQPQSDDDKALKGMLQAAIDETGSINGSFAADSKINAVADMAPDG